ncbi:MAG: hypothetical protein IPK71_06330 [Myxococcales bacterium]|jgi:hypothetical protein|nr:hypothetical protein [Myxococcales bacterium]
MPVRSLALVFVACSALLVSACTITTVPSSGGEGDEGGEGPPSATAARCVGKPVEAYTMRDSASCANQGSTWSDTYLECRGTSFVVNCARADTSGRPEEAKKIMCLDMPGCGWTEPDGTVTKPSGRCEGTKTPCSAFSQTECRSQPGCTVESSSCKARNGRYYLDNMGCENLQISNSVSFSVVRNACQRAKGCTWVE